MPLTLLMAWRGDGSDQSIHWATFDGTPWSAQQSVPGAVTSNDPALVIFNGQPFMAWNGGAGDSNVYSATFDGKTRSWSPGQKVLVPLYVGSTHLFGIGTDHSPALAVFQGQLYMAWKGVGGDKTIWWSFSSDGTNWAPQHQNANVGTSNFPAIASFQASSDPNPLLYMAWRGTDSDQSLYWATFDGGNWTSQQPVPNAGTSEAPTLAVFRGQLFMAWKGVLSDDPIYLSAFDGKTRSWSPRQQVLVPINVLFGPFFGVGTTRAPTLAVFQDHLYMAWKGSGDDNIWWSSNDNTFIGEGTGGIRWMPQQQNASVRTSNGPALVTADISAIPTGWGGPESLGGPLPPNQNLRFSSEERSSAISWGVGRLDVFAVDSGGSLQHWWWPGPTGWGGPESLGGNLLDWSAVSWGVGRLDVFGSRVSNEILQHWWWPGPNGAWGGPEVLGDHVGEPRLGAISWGTGRLDVFAMSRANDPPLQHWWWPGPDGKWGGPESLAGEWGFGSAVSWGPNRLDVFGDSPLHHWWWPEPDGKWGGPESLGGDEISQLSAVSWGIGRLDVFGLSYNLSTRKSTLQHWWWPGPNGWGGPESLGGNLVNSGFGDHPLSAISWGAGRLDVFALDANFSLLHWWWPGPNGWGGPEVLGDQVGSTPSVVSWGTGRLDVFAVHAIERRLLHWWWPGPNGRWGGPEFLGGNLVSLSAEARPRAVSWGPGRLDVFALDSQDHTLQHWWWPA